MSRTAHLALGDMERQRNTDGVTVGQLRRALADLPDDVLVVMSSDGEGNHYSPLADGSVGLYSADTTYSGEYHVRDEQIGHDGFAEEDRAGDDAVAAVVLWPTN